MIVIVEDEPLVRRALARGLKSDFPRLSFFASAEELLRSETAATAGAFLIDLGLPGLSGLDLITALRLKGATGKILVYSGDASPKTILDAFKAGADGYVLKPDISTNILEAFRDLVAGGHPMSPVAAERLIDLARESLTGSAADLCGDAPTLSARELEILRELSRGRSRAEIALQFGISSETVKTHVGRCYEKLGVKGQVDSRRQAVARARQWGLLGK